MEVTAAMGKGLHLRDMEVMLQSRKREEQ